jgi:hypothetical protein
MRSAGINYKRRDSLNSEAAAAGKPGKRPHGSDGGGNIRDHGNTGGGGGGNILGGGGGDRSGVDGANRGGSMEVAATAAAGAAKALAEVEGVGPTAAAADQEGGGDFNNPPNVSKFPSLLFSLMGWIRFSFFSSFLLFVPVMVLKISLLFFYFYTHFKPCCK